MSDLAGEVTVKIGESMFGTPVVLVEQDLTSPSDPSPIKYAGWLPVSREILEDSMALEGVVTRVIDRWLNPWKYPDRIAWPTPNLFPHAAAFVASVRKARDVVRATRARCRAAWHVLWYGIDEQEDDWT